MRRFIKKVKRKLRKINYNPRVIGLLSVLIVGIFAYTISTVFAESEVTFELDSFLAEEDANENITLTPQTVFDRGDCLQILVKFDTTQNWDSVMAKLEFDTDVFEYPSFEYKVLKYDGTKWGSNSNVHNSIVAHLNHIELLENGVLSMTYNNLDNDPAGQNFYQFNGGIRMGSLSMCVKANAEGGDTTIHYVQYASDDSIQTGLFQSTVPYEATVVDKVLSIKLDVDPSSIEASVDSLSLDLTDNPTGQITPVYQPAGANYPPINKTYSSSDDAVVTVDGEGNVTAHSIGGANITMNVFGESVVIPVTVTAHLKAINLDELTVDLNKGGTHSFTVTTTPNPTSDQNDLTYSWSSSNPSKVTVTNAGVVTGVSGGYADVTATALINGVPTDPPITKTARVNVNVPFDSVTPSPSSLTLKKGIENENSKRIDVVTGPTDATQELSIEWESSDPTVATVTGYTDSNTGGKYAMVTAVGKGTATITGTVDNYATPISVTVSVEVPILTFTTSPDTATLYVSQNTTITPTFNPTEDELTETHTITWASDTPSVATVANGVVTAVGPGTAHITATTGANDRLSDTTTVTVYTAIQGATMSESAFTIYTNDNDHHTKNLTVSVNPPGAGSPSDNEIDWESDTPGVATVANGVVTAVSNGTAIITATLGSGAQATATVTVETKVESVNISELEAWIEKGSSTYSISATVSPNNASDKTISWETDDPSVATVANGVVTGVEVGTAIITATAGGKSKQVTIHVKISATKVEINEGPVIRLERGQSANLTVTKTPSDTTDTLTWESNREDRVTVTSGGVVTASSTNTGPATITAKLGDTVTDTITVEVVIPATAFSITTEDFSINVGNTFQIQTSVTPTNTTDTIGWVSSDETKVTVDTDGTVHALATTTDPVRVTGTINGISDHVDITVLLPANSITITNTKPMTLQKGANATLNTTVDPEGATGTINWTSSNQNVATVANGVVTAVGGGQATITASLGNVSDTIVVNVESHASSIAINQSNFSMVKGTSETLTVTLDPDDVTDMTTWSSTNSNVVSVTPSADGKSATVNAVAAGGPVTITATNGNKASTVEVTVLVHTSSITVKEGTTNVPTTMNMNNGTSKTFTVTLNPSDSTDAITWDSTETSKVTVTPSADGKSATITAVDNGSSVITATSGDKTFTTTITVVTPATSIAIGGNENITIHRGSSEQLTATVSPSNSTDTITWTSDSNAVTVTPSANGSTATLTANTITTSPVRVTVRAGSKTDYVNVTVDAPIQAFTSTETNVSVVKKQTKQLVYTVTPSDTTEDYTITWTSNGTSVATVDSNGLVTAKGEGSTTVVATLTSTSGTRDITYNVTVTIIPVEGITLNKDNMEVYKGVEDTSLTYTFTPENTTEDEVTWECDEPTILTVDQNGKLKGLREGTAHVTVRAGTYSDTVTVTVIEVPLTGIAIDNASDTAEIGEDYQIIVKKQPLNSTDDVEFTFESSDESIATVDENGIVKGKKPGTVTITVHSSIGDYEASIELNVVVPKVPSNPNTGVRSLLGYLLSAIISLFGAAIIVKKRFN